MLVLLGRQGQNLLQAVTSHATLSQSIPRLEGKDDPLLPAVDALIGMTRLRTGSRASSCSATRSRKPRAAPFRHCFWRWARRALLAARAPGRHRHDPASPQKHHESSTREVAARTLGAMLDADRTGRGPGDRVAKAIVRALETAGP